MNKFQFISENLSSAGVNYEFGEWTQDVIYPYFVGELTENSITTEDGMEESTMILDGFHRGKRIALEEAKEKIMRLFHPTYGLRGSTDSGSIAVFFDGAFYIPTGEADFKRMQINLKIKEWKGE